MSITNIDLKGYAVSHIREKSYHCYQCEKEIAKYAYLQQHMSIHIREKPYPCCQCDESFRKRKSDLKMHMVTHFGEKL